MKIPVVGFDPSLTHWGVAFATLNLTEGYLETPELEVIEPTKLKGKQVRQNSTDMDVAEQLGKAALDYARRAKAVFVECPVGSQSARAMASYGVCVGILGVIRAEGIPLIEVTAIEVKKALHGTKDATKAQMIAAAVAQYPKAKFPMHGGKITQKAEHVADAIGAIHAGVTTPVFQQLMRILEKV